MTERKREPDPPTETTEIGASGPQGGAGGAPSKEPAAGPETADVAPPMDFDATKPFLRPGASPFERHVFVCVSGGTCPTQGGEAVHAALKDLASRRCGPVSVRVNKSGCMAQCGHGPMVCVYPDNVWYAGVRADDVTEIVERHLVGGEPVERLLFRGHHEGPNAMKS